MTESETRKEVARILSEWHQSGHSALALIEPFAAALRDAERRGLERALNAVKAEANALPADAKPDYYKGFKAGISTAITAIRNAES